MEKISFIIPCYNGFKYTKFCYNNLRENYPNDEIIIVDGSEGDETKEYIESLNDYNLIYQKTEVNVCRANIGEKLATCNILVFLHNDMYVSKNFKQKLLENITPNNIIQYTRVEPPIFPNEEIGKCVMDFGYEPEDFKKDDFENFSLSYNKKYKHFGSSFFMACYKHNWIGIDDKTFYDPRFFYSDNDLHLRYRILGVENIHIDALVYHFVSKTSRFKGYEEIEKQSSYIFQNKWNKIINLNQ